MQYCRVVLKGAHPRIYYSSKTYLSEGTESNAYCVTEKGRFTLMPREGHVPQARHQCCDRSKALACNQRLMGSLE